MNEFIFAFEEDAQEFLSRASRFGFIDLADTQPKKSRGAWSIKIPYALYHHLPELQTIAEDLV